MCPTWELVPRPRALLFERYASLWMAPRHLVILVGLLAACVAAPERAARVGCAPATFRDRLADGGVGPEMVAIRPGRFAMGDLQGDGDPDERPAREVEITTRSRSRGTRSPSTSTSGTASRAIVRCPTTVASGAGADRW